MPAFVFTGHTGQVYPESKDAEGHPIGPVEVGDQRDLTEPLDGQWVSARSNAAKAAQDEAERRAKEAERDAKGDGSEEAVLTSAEEGAPLVTMPGADTAPVKPATEDTPASGKTDKAGDAGKKGN